MSAAQLGPSKASAMAAVSAPSPESDPGRRRGLSTFVQLLALALLLLGFASWLEGSEVVRDPYRWLSQLDNNGARELLVSAAQVVAGVLAVLITVVAIVVELAANRYTHRITQLFIRDRVNVMVLAFFVLTAVLCVGLAVVLTSASTRPPLVPHGGFMLTMGLMAACMLMLLPYFAYVFRFVSPHQVIRRIRLEALEHVEEVDARSANAAKRAVIRGVEELEDVARGAMEHSDRSIAMAAIAALVNLLEDVLRARASLPNEWFAVDDSVTSDADFVAMSNSAMAEVQEKQMWFESKILRQCLALFGDAVGNARDVASMISIHTRMLAQQFGAANPALREQCQRAFNSYLRASINARDPRTAYYVWHQYRLLAEDLYAAGEPELVAETGERLRFYGEYASGMGLPFLLEVAAYDIAQLIEACASNAPLRDRLLETLLSMDLKDVANPMGVRRAQLQMATFFLVRGEQEPVQRIANALARERLHVLEGARSALEHELSPHYWEINDRGLNFSYLAPDRRAQLEPLFSLLGYGVPKAVAH